MYKKLFSETLTYGLAAMSVKLSSFMIIPIIANELSPSEFGFLELIITISSVLYSLIILNINESQLKFGLESNNKYEKNVINLNTLVISVFLFLITFLCFIVVSLILFLYGYTSPLFIFLLFLFLIFESLKIIFLNITRIDNSLSKYLKSEVANAIIFYVSCYFMVVNLQLDYRGYMLAVIFSNVVSIIYLFFSNNTLALIKSKTKLSNQKIQKKLINFSLPLLPNSVLWWIVSASDKMMISFLLGLTATGYFGIASKIPAIISVIYAIFLKAWQSFLYSNKYEKNLKSLSNIILVLLYCISCMTYLVADRYSEQLILLISNSDYLKASSLLPVLVLASSLMMISSFLGAELMLKSKTKVILKSSIVGGGINIIFSFIFIHLLGLDGASISTLLSAGIMISMRMSAINHKSKIYRVLILITFIMVLWAIINLYI